MANPKTRWECPNGCGAVMGPRRPRKDDVRRYCLPCSEDSGRLVNRIAPVLEKERKAAAERAAEKRQAAKARKRKAYEAKWVVRTRDAAGTAHEIDLLKEVRRVCKLAGRGMPEVTVHRPKFGDAGGRCWPGRRIHLTVGRTVQSHEWMQALIAHEVAHLWHHQTSHGRRWREQFLRIAHKAYPGFGKVSAKSHGYVMHDKVVARMRDATKRKAGVTEDLSGADVNTRLLHPPKD